MLKDVKNVAYMLKDVMCPEAFESGFHAKRPPHLHFSRSLSRSRLAPDLKVANMLNDPTLPETSGKWLTMLIDPPPYYNSGKTRGGGVY